jgi:prolipoprotein diacylglyceryltransferase
MTLGINETQHNSFKCYYAECRIFIDVLSVVMLSVINLSVVMLSVIMLSVIMLNVGILSIMALLAQIEKEEREKII